MFSQLYYTKVTFYQHEFKGTVKFSNIYDKQCCIKFNYISNFIVAIVVLLCI